MKIKKIEAVLIFDEKQESCPHKPEWIESQFNEDEQWALCTRCNKDLTKVYTADWEAKYPDYGDLYDQQRDELPF